MRGLTGRSTGGATAGHLARAALFVYPAPRGQGSLPCLPGYLYVRPRWQQRKSSRTSARFGFICRFSRRAASTAASRRRGTPSVPRVRSAPGRAIVLRGSAQGPVVVGASRQRAAPRSQSVGAPRTDGLARLAVAVHAALGGGSGSVANVGESEGACAA